MRQHGCAVFRETGGRAHAVGSGGSGFAQARVYGFSVCEWVKGWVEKAVWKEELTERCRRQGRMQGNGVGAGGGGRGGMDTAGSWED